MDSFSTSDLKDLAHQADYILEEELEIHYFQHSTVKKAGGQLSSWKLGPLVTGQMQITNKLRIISGTNVKYLKTWEVTLQEEKDFFSPVQLKFAACTIKWAKALFLIQMLVIMIEWSMLTNMRFHHPKSKELCILTIH